MRPLKKKSIALNLFLKVPSAVLAELSAHGGYESITIDMQHGLIGYSDMLKMIQALKPTTPFVRVASNNYEAIGKALDAGAQGIICPMINSREEAMQFVSACYFSPAGLRSYGPTRANLANPDYFNTYSITLKTFAMIETRRAIERLGEIASVNGLTGLYVGPTDLSIDLGLSNRVNFSDSSILSAIESVIQAAHNNRKEAGIHVYSEDDFKVAVSMGFDFITIADDFGLLLNSAKERSTRYNKIIDDFMARG